VGLPIGLVHWLIVERLARDPAERGAALRRLSHYVGLAIAILVVIGSIWELTRALVERLVGADPSARWTAVTDPAATLVVWSAIWALLWFSAIRDRAQVGERGASATIRRWYVYGVSFWALILLVLGVAGTVQQLWEVVAAPPVALPGRALGDSVGAALAGLVGWLFHWRWSSTGPIAADDRRSTLRTVAIMLAIGFGAAVTLAQLARALYYALARALGADTVAAITEPLAVALAGPVSYAIAGGVAWWYHRLALAADLAAEAPTTRQVTVRRFAHYLTALVAVAILSFGVGGVLWTLADLTTGSPGGATFWRDQISLSATATLVGLPVWLAYWRPVVAVDEAGSLPRRLYVYLVVAGAMLAVIGAAATVAYQLLTIALGTSDPAVGANLARGGAVMVTGAAVLGYHLLALWRDHGRIAAAPPTPSLAPRAPGDRPIATLTLTSAGGGVLRQVHGDRATLERLLNRLVDELSAEQRANANTSRAPADPRR
ncbi:MAG: DUF5671 domain-containing protein, partial [Dehalococcoidia bacterium]|nr:DUF5671 domain-containing protein [Dehalococcoidia bacterium]